MYHHLMNSKDEFLTSLSPAASRSLTTSYELLEDAWNRNNTEALKKTLDQRYQELRRIQSELRSNFDEFSKSIEQELKASLRKKSERLKTERENFEEKRTNSNELFETWKVDITKEEQNLIALQERYATISLMRTEAEQLQQVNSVKRRSTLSVLSKRLEQTLSKLGETQKLNAQALSSREELLATWRQDLQRKRQAFLDGLKNKSVPGLPTMQGLSVKKKQASANLKRAQETSKRALEVERKSLEESLHDFENKSLEQLWNEQLAQVPDMPDDLRKFLREEPISLRLLKLKRIEKERMEHLKTLTRVLTKRGIDLDDFLAQYEATHPS